MPGVDAQPSAGVPGPWLAPEGRAFRLSDAAHGALADLWQPLGLEPGRARVAFGYTARASAFVLGRRITLHRRRFAALSRPGQLALLAHELVHVAQYKALGRAGIARFLWRYMPEYHLDPNNYRVPDALARTPLAQVALLDPRYTLDQIAERFRLAYR